MGFKDDPAVSVLYRIVLPSALHAIWSTFFCAPNVFDLPSASVMSTSAPGPAPVLLTASACDLSGEIAAWITLSTRHTSLPLASFSASPAPPQSVLWTKPAVVHANVIRV